MLTHRVLVRHADTPLRQLPEQLLKRLAQAWEQEVKASSLGSAQVLVLVNKAKALLTDSRLVSAWEEVRLIRALVQSPDTVRMNETTGVIRLSGRHGLYQMRVTLTVPEAYPDEPVKVDLVDSTFPAPFVRMIIAQLQEISRMAIEGPLIKAKSKAAVATQQRRLSDYPPGQEPERLHAREMRQPHDPEPSLIDLARFFIYSAVHRFPQEVCPLCKARVLPEDPAAWRDVGGAGKVVYLYCGHLYHYACLNKFMRNPPFDQGKPCAACSRPVYHSSWPDDHKVLEARWAHDQARQREVCDVADFLGLS